MTRPAISFTNNELAEIRAATGPRARYLSLNPRTILQQGTVSSVERDSESGFITKIIHLSYGDQTGILPGMSIDIGTTAGARDIGTVRIRRLDNTPEAAAIWLVEETALPIAAGQHLTVRNEYQLRSKMPRIVRTKTGNSTYYNAFAEYHDYDVSYASQNGAVAVPQAIIYTDAPAGWVNPITEVRTVTLDASESFSLNGSAGTLTYVWYVQDGEIVDGTQSSTQITVEFPEGFRYVDVEAIDALGNAHRAHCPIWAHSDNYPPLTAFSISKDTTSEWREMGFEYFGQLDVVPLQVGCYWEDQTEITSDLYRSYFLGYISTKTDSYQLYNNRTSFDLVGAGGILEKTRCYAQDLEDKGRSPQNWWEIQSITTDKAIQYALREYSTYPTLHGWKRFGKTQTAKEEKIKATEMWAQIKDLATTYMGEARTDSSGMLWLTIPSQYRSEDGLVPIITLSSSDYTYDPALSETEEFTAKLGAVSGAGSYYSGGKSTVVYSQAPRKTAGTGSTEELPFQRLPVTNAQAILNRLTGQHFAKLNVQTETYSIQLVGNWDVWETAWNKPIQLWWDDGSQSAYFRVTEISIAHNNEDSGKKITWTLEKLRSWSDGITMPPPPPSDIASPPVTDWPPPQTIFDGIGIVPPPTVTPPSDTPLEEPPTQTTGEISKDGNSVLVVTDDNRLLCTFDFKRSDEPLSFDITPMLDEGETLVHAIWGKFLTADNGASLYALSVLDGQSRVWYCENIRSETAGWVEGEWMDREYQFIRKAVNGIYVYTSGNEGGAEPPPETWTHTIDLTVSNGGFAQKQGYAYGAWVEGVGWQGTNAAGGYSAVISMNFTEAVTFTEVTVACNYNPVGNLGVAINNFAESIYFNNEATPLFDGSYGYTGVGKSVTELILNPYVNAGQGGNFIITSITLSGTGYNPFNPTAYTWCKKWSNGDIPLAYAAGWQGTTPSGLDTTNVFNWNGSTFYAYQYKILSGPGVDAPARYVESIVLTFDTPIAEIYGGVGDYSILPFNANSYIYNTLSIDGNKVTIHVNAFIYNLAFLLQTANYDPGYINTVEIYGTGTIPPWMGESNCTSGGGGGGGVAANASSQYSTDHGATWGAVQEVGAMLTVGGADAFNNVLIAACENKVRISNGAGGAYSDYGAALTDPIEANCIVIPRKKFGINYVNDTEPEYMGLSSAGTQDSENIIWRTKTSGLAPIKINAKESTNFGLVPTANAAAVSAVNSAKLAAILQFDTLRKLVTSINSGGTWKIRSTLTADAGYIRMRKTDTQAVELYYTDGVPKYSANFGAASTSKVLTELGTAKAITIEVLDE